MAGEGRKLCSNKDSPRGLRLLPAAATPSGSLLAESAVHGRGGTGLYVVPVNVVDPAGERVGSSPDGAFTLTIPARHVPRGL